MKIGPTLLGFGLLTVLYVGALIYLDQQNHVFQQGIDVARLLPQVAFFAFISFVLRSLRWRWLLGRRDFHVRSIPGFLAYISGLALTASPGKVGELVRVRYFGALGVPANQVISCFVFERMLDLIVVLLLATLLAGRAPGVAIAFGFVALVIITIIVLARSASLWVALTQWLGKARWHGSARLSTAIGQGLAGAMTFFRPLEFAVSITIGAAAWTIQSIGCLYLMAKLGIALPPLAAFGVYPLALLIGAASMLPGGIGTTEAAIVFLLHGYDVPLQLAVLAAIGMRLSTLWFAIALGLLAIPILECVMRKSDHGAPSADFRSIVHSAPADSRAHDV
jgi:uncharacterized protein (TIRG00374 family)